MFASSGIQKCADQLAQLLAEPLSSIELLPGDVDDWSSAGLTVEMPFLLQEGNLGIPINCLYKLYPLAATQFTPALKTYRAAPSPASAAPVLSSSSIVVLANPAHQTTLNARKALVQNSHLDPRRELDFTAHLLAAGKDAAKQSTLWDHRRWLLSWSYPCAASRETSGGVHPRGWSRDGSRCSALPPSIIERELALALRACEMYPRNYHAWVYRHAIFESVRHMLSEATSPRSELLELVVREAQRIMAWIDRHVADYTAAQHVCSVVLAFHEYAPSADSVAPDGNRVSGRPSPLSNPHVLAEHAMELLRTYPEHEALRRYLRLALRMFPPPAELARRANELLHEGEINTPIRIAV
ncbi:hypothetical protein HDZ31DRAFT_63505 [Schizophyllum fasciatum]